jgi:hypothetical protein
MDLTEYGNRIPSLTFEVIADDGSVAIGDVIMDISGQRITLAQGDGVIGFAAGGEDREAALRSLTDSVPLSFSCDPAAINRIEATLRGADDPVGPLPIASDFARSVGQQDIAPAEMHNASVATVPRKLSVRYYDPARDYQTGIQSAFRPGSGRLSLVREYPATMMADQARVIATTGLWSEYDDRSTRQLAVPLDSRSYRPGMVVECGDADGLWTIRECEILSGFVKLSLTRTRAGRAMGPVETEQGRNVPDADLRAGPTRLVLVDLPFAIDAPTTVSDSARLYAAAAGDAGWRNAQLFASGVDGTPGIFVGQIPAPTVIGTTSGALDPANSALMDRISQIDVELQNPAMSLAHADDSQLLAGQNIALIGQELIQFAEAVPLGDGHFRLSRMIRGLGGTEAEIARHQANEDFVLLDSGSMLEIGSAAYTPFAPAVLFALGRDDPAPVSAAVASTGRALMPWSPVHPGWRYLDNGDLEIGWTRRSRAGSVWRDHVEVPLAEEDEQYRVELSADNVSVAPLLLNSEVPRIVVAAAQLDRFIINNINNISVSIWQIGASGQSSALIFEVPL